jgi:hypothetical protein
MPVKHLYTQLRFLDAAMHAYLWLLACTDRHRQLSFVSTRLGSDRSSIGSSCKVQLLEWLQVYDPSTYFQQRG